MGSHQGVVLSLCALEFLLECVESCVESIVFVYHVFVHLLRAFKQLLEMFTVLLQFALSVLQVRYPKQQKRSIVKLNRVKIEHSSNRPPTGALLQPLLVYPKSDCNIVYSLS